MPRAFKGKASLSNPLHCQRLTSILQKGIVCAEVIVTAIALSWAGAAKAELQAPNTAPPELLQVLSDIDTAASSRDLESVMQHVSPDFTHADGLDYESLEAALQLFWERFESLDYTTELIGWQTDDDNWVVETRTTIVGLDVIGSRSGRLNSVIESRQQFSDMLLINQAVMHEESQLTLGSNAPTLDINLPEKVGIGQTFSFDAIVLEPLGDRILLGSAFDEPVNAEGYITPVVIDLDLLSAGGLFKIGRAPTELGDRWISGIIVRNDGITTMTRRLQVVSPEDAPEEFQAD